MLALLHLKAKKTNLNHLDVVTSVHIIKQWLPADTIELVPRLECIKKLHLKLSPHTEYDMFTCYDVLTVMMVGDNKAMWQKILVGTGPNSIFNSFIDDAGADLEYVRRAKMYKLAWYSVFMDGTCRLVGRDRAVYRWKEWRGCWLLVVGARENSVDDDRCRLIDNATPQAMCTMYAMCVSVCV